MQVFNSHRACLNTPLATVRWVYEMAPRSCNQILLTHGRAISGTNIDYEVLPRYQRKNNTINF